MRAGYRSIDAALLRASTSTADVVPQSWPPFDVDADVEPWCRSHPARIAAGCRAGTAHGDVVGPVSGAHAGPGDAVRAVRRGSTGTIRRAGGEPVDRRASATHTRRRCVARRSDRTTGVALRAAAPSAG